MTSADDFKEILLNKSEKSMRKRQIVVKIRIQKEMVDRKRSLDLLHSFSQVFLSFSLTMVTWLPKYAPVRLLKKSKFMLRMLYLINYNLNIDLSPNFLCLSHIMSLLRCRFHGSTPALITLSSR